LVGELTAKETLCYLLIRNKIESCNISIPISEENNESVDLYIYNKSSPKIKVHIINGSPFIKLNLNLEAKILSFDSDYNSSLEEKLSEISLSANKYIESTIAEYLYRTSVNLNADINGFGQYALPLFLTREEFDNYKWLENYKDSTFDVTVSTNVTSAFLLGGNS